MRATLDLEWHIPRFTALSAEALAWARCYRQQDAAGLADAQAQLMVMVAQCEDTLERIRSARAAAAPAWQPDFTSSPEASKAWAAARAGGGAHRRPWPPPGATTPAGFARFYLQCFIAENRRNSLAPLSPAIVPPAGAGDQPRRGNRRALYLRQARRIPADVALGRDAGVI